MTKPHDPHTTVTARRPTPTFRAAFLAVAVALLSPTPRVARAQDGVSGMTVGVGIRTIATSPPDAQVRLVGSSELTATSPVELDPQWTGRYAVTVFAPGYASARGVLYLPEDGSTPRTLSPPPGLSGGLLLRSLNYPGVPQLLDHRTARGAAFAIAATGGIGAAVRDHVEFKDKNDQPDFESQDKAEGFEYARGRWIVYSGVVWGMSALDHILRARMDVLEATPTKVTVGTQQLTRGGVLLRSALVPGAGQDYANRRDRGLFWLGATLTSGAAYLIALESHKRIEIKLDRAKALLATAGPGEVAIRQEDVAHFTSREEDSQKLVDRLALSTGLIYVANIIDAGIVPLQGGSSEKGFSLNAPVSPHRAEIALSYRF